MTRLALALLGLAACAAASRAAAQPADAAAMPLDDVRAGQQGEVWTVFQGTKPEPFSVEVAGIIQNALGPGKSMILCRLTDPRVQNMGAVAGMSGSPLYIGGRFAGAMSYQIQRFETVRYAGFTPAADMAEVAERVGVPPAEDQGPALPSDLGPAARDADPFRPMNPVFALGGVSPRTAALVAPYFAAEGVDVVAPGGSRPAAGGAAGPLRPGDAVSVALATGDITLAGTGTVSRVDGNRVVAFGHPMLGLGDVALPMCSAEVVAILPSTLESFKVANVGPVIGCVTEDRLSAVSGLLGAGPEMTEVVVDTGRGAGARSIRFQAARDRRIAPLLLLTGILEGVVGSNDFEAAEGFRIASTVTFAPGERLSREAVYAGQQGLAAGLLELVTGLAAGIQNPFERAIPTRVEFRVERLARNPAVTVESFQVSRATARAGDRIAATLAWRDFQGAEESATVEIPVDPSWAGKTLEVLVAPGRVLDELTGHGYAFRPGQLRSFGAYLEAMREHRREDGVFVAVVERSALFFDQAAATPDMPASIERIAAASDAARFQRRDAILPLWETHLLAGRVTMTDLHRTVRIVE